MKTLLILCFGCLFISCKAQKVHEYVKNFEKHEPKLVAITQFLELNRDTLLQLGCNNHIKGTQMDLDHNSVQENCYGVFNDTLNSFLNAGVFETLSMSKDGEIEFMLDFSPAEAIVSNETTRYYFYCPNSELPKPYDTWAVQVKLKDHWWYLEYTNAGF